MAIREDLTIPARRRVDRRFAVWADAAHLVPADLTGWTAAAQVRVSWPGPDVLHEFACVVEAAAVRITATAAQTALWPQLWPTLRTVWDLVLTDPGGNPAPALVGGWLTVLPTVTR